MTIRTFHSLCYNILRKFGSKEFDNRFRILDNLTYDDIEPKLKAPETQKEIFQKIIKQLSENAEYLLKLKRYILDYYIDEYRRKIQKGKYTEYEKPYTTLGGEQVRSKSERYIADWLYIHNIKYLYEPQLILQDFPFKPDFYIPQADAYLEHVSNLSHNMKDKEEQFEVANKLLIKTYESMTKDISAFYEALARRIIPRINENIKRDVALNVESEFRAHFKQLDEFVSMLIVIMNKIKVENISIEEVYLRASKDPHERVRVFYELAKPILEEYREYCIRRSYLDFNDLIILAIRLLENDSAIGSMFKNKFHHILVDEFQDVNTLQIKLLNHLLREDNRLFCVGDDWQGIYSWRGSEVDYIVNFKKYFENAQIIKLDTNYRSNETIVRASNEVIKNNEYKIDKELKALKKEGKKLYLYCAKKEEEDGVEKVVSIISELLQKGYRKDNILVLYRKSKAIEPYRDKLKGMATLRTIHSAKGLEAEIVFIVGLTGGISGFPQVWESDRIVQTVKQSNFKFLMEEERRLFYVALTRAKDELFIITEMGNESMFIKEIPIEFVERSNFLDSLNFSTRLSNKKCSKCLKELELHFSYCPYCSEAVHS
ncbi:MAG: UvrD-helicase domain-containing protein [Nanoarchaeota archaeon]